MSLEDRQRWEPRHEAARLLEPRSSVAGLVPFARERRVLDVACGQGRHALALAAGGGLVVAFDIARSALGHLAARAGDSILAVQGDVDSWPFAAESFDLVVQVDFLDRALLPVLARTVAPGGMVLVDTFAAGDRPNTTGPSRPDYLVAPGELARAFAGFEVLVDRIEGGPTTRTVFLARRPAAPLQP